MSCFDDGLITRRKRRLIMFRGGMIGEEREMVITFSSEPD